MINQVGCGLYSLLVFHLAVLPPVLVLLDWLSLTFRFLILPWRLATVFWSAAMLDYLVNRLLSYSVTFSVRDILAPVSLVTAYMTSDVDWSRLAKASSIPNGLPTLWTPWCAVYWRLRRYERDSIK